ncbi:MAG: zf-HC2 domain-containing protein [Verrucomicrobiota bacterium]|jgi:anti-sigma factor RsiW
MNCRDFQDEVFEFLDGTLSPGKRARAERHLAQCGVCREALRRHQQLAQSLPARLRRETESLALRPEVKRRIEAAFAEAATAPAAEHPLLGFLRQFAWPAAIATALFVAVGLSLYGPFRAHVQNTETARQPEHNAAPVAISIRMSYCDPTYVFHRENNLVIDVLTCTPQVVEENLRLSLNQNPVPQLQERKTPL